MESTNDVSKKRRRFSQQQISIRSIPLKNKDSIGLQSLQRFKKLNHRNSLSRKSMDIEKVSKCELSLGVMKRQTDWNKSQIDTIEFQKIIEQRRHKNRFKFKTIEIQSIQSRQNSCLERPCEMERIKSVVDFQIKNERKFSLEKESIQFNDLEKELKELNDRQVQEMTKNKMMGELVGLLSCEISKYDQKQVQKERSLSVVQKYSQAIRKQQQKKDLFIRMSNEIKQKIINSKKEIFAYRSERVVYSSLFKELQRQIKLAQNIYNRILINSMSFFQSFCLSRLEPGRVRRQFQVEKTEAALQSYNDYSNMFSSMLGTNGVKFIGTLNFNEEQLLNDRINSNTAINYYLKSRKVIILPRYKEHYQPSRNKIKVEAETLSYEQLANQVNRFFQVLSLDDLLLSVKPNEPASDHIKMEKSFGSLSFYKNKTDTPNSPNKLIAKTKNSHQSTGSQFSRTSTNFQFLTQSKIDKLKTLANDLPTQNQALFNQISKVDTLIDQTVALIQEEQKRIALFETQMPPSQKTFKSIGSDSASDQPNFSFQQQLQVITNLLGIGGPQLSEKRLISALHKLQELQLATKTACLFDKPQSLNKNQKDRYDPKDRWYPSPSKNGPSENDTERSNISIKFKKRDNNLPSPQKNIQNTHKEVTITQNTIFCRAPQTINSILKNIQVYESYERAFERMDFQKEYETEKNRKKRTLIRRDGMVSLCLLKAHEQKKLLKRQSSNKRQQ